MRIVLLSEFYCKGMGYLENILPKYLARRGVETHVVATDLPPDYRQQPASRAYREFSKKLQPGSVEEHNGYSVHILGHERVMGHMRMAGLRKKLHSIRPDIVQTMTPIGWIPLEAALLRPFLRYKLFTGCHHHASVFPLATKKSRLFSLERFSCTITRTIPGGLVSLETERCYAITSDCSDVAVRFFGVPAKKVEICPLGVDTDLFYPASSREEMASRSHLRQRLGFADSDIVCVYTGRFSDDKNPELLARAVESLSLSGLPYRGLFIGNGAQAEAIACRSGCKTHPFVPVTELSNFYRAADIGVWPAQESMSMLDAAACGLPIVVNDTMSAPERIEGNGLYYRLNDLADLIQILQRLHDPVLRRTLGSCGAQKIVRDFSWASVAERRIRGYEIALSEKKQSKVEAVAP
jgi:glycosyltransferase involved in cell wall biosynthesis